MPLTISFQLSDRDLQFFHDRMEQAKAKTAALGEGEIAESARRLLAEMKKADLPDFVRERVATLDLMLLMLDDGAWKLDGEDRVRIANALAYVADPDDLIPDNIPGFGYLDDALMIDMVSKQLAHDIQGYQDFCKFRIKERARVPDSTHATQEKYLATRRAQLKDRIHRRRAALEGRLGSF